MRYDLATITGTTRTNDPRPVCFAVHSRVTANVAAATIAREDTDSREFRAMDRTMRSNRTAAGL